MCMRVCIYLYIYIYIYILIYHVCMCDQAGGATKKGVGKPTVYNSPQFPLYTNMHYCLRQWSATN